MDGFIVLSINPTDPDLEDILNITIESNNQALISDYYTDGESTTLVMVAPSSGPLFEVDSENGFVIDAVIMTSMARFIKLAMHNPICHDFAHQRKVRLMYM